MLTIAEAMQRAAINGFSIFRTTRAGTVWAVYLNEWNRQERDDNAYYTDDLEDAVLMGAIMRSKRHQLVVGAFKL